LGWSDLNRLERIPMADDQDKKDEIQGRLIGAGSVLGVGIGAAVGAATGNLGTGIWIGAVIGVGLGMLAGILRK
jgi:hypothetical protein